MNSLFTIGHSSHTMEAFLQLLAAHQIGAIADVRSQPYSRRFPQFSKQVLSSFLAEVGIHYIFLGRELGARRDERECFVNGAVFFDLVAASPLFASGLKRLQEELKKHRISLLCAEKDPLDCHRTILVARHAARFAEVHHILADGKLESQGQTECRLLQRYDRSDADMFLSYENRLAEAYLRRGAEIAWIGENSGETP